MTQTLSHLASPTAQILPNGVVLRPLASRDTEAVGTVEMFRKDWAMAVTPVQWNFVRSEPNSLRGVHVHARHWDYLCILDGEMLLGLHDMRPDSSTFRQAVFQTLRGDRPSGLSIPPGVAHGFYFRRSTEYVYGTSEYWNMADEFGCMWNDPELHLDWPASSPILSPRDSSASSYAEMAQGLANAMHQGHVAP